MKVVEVRELEDCFDKSQTRELILDSELTRDFIIHLGALGEFEFHEDFGRPFFKVSAPHMFILKGVQGNKSMKAILSRADPAGSLSLLIAHAEKF